MCRNWTKNPTQTPKSILEYPQLDGSQQESPDIRSISEYKYTIKSKTIMPDIEPPPAEFMFIPCNNGPSFYIKPQNTKNSYYFRV